jgi:hypothetical protein
VAAVSSCPPYWLHNLWNWQRNNGIWTSHLKSTLNYNVKRYGPHFLRICLVTADILLSRKNWPNSSVSKLNDRFPIWPNLLKSTLSLHIYQFSNNLQICHLILNEWPTDTEFPTEMMFAKAWNTISSNFSSILTYVWNIVAQFILSESLHDYTRNKDHKRNQTRF